MRQAWSNSRGLFRFSIKTQLSNTHPSGSFPLRNHTGAPYSGAFRTAPACFGPHAAAANGTATKPPTITKTKCHPTGYACQRSPNAADACMDGGKTVSFFCVRCFLEVTQMTWDAGVLVDARRPAPGFKSRDVDVRDKDTVVFCAYRVVAVVRNRVGNRVVAPEDVVAHRNHVLFLGREIHRSVPHSLRIDVETLGFARGVLARGRSQECERHREEHEKPCRAHRVARGGE